LSYCNRRNFIKSCALAGAALETGLFDFSAHAAGAVNMSIARYKTSPTAPDGISEEAQRLTRQAIEALGGMSRFISKGDVVWVKPNIGWARRPEQAATTNPDVVATVIEMCFQAGAKSVLVSDNPCNPVQQSYALSGIQQAAKKAGAQSDFMDARKYRKMAINGKVLTEWEIYTDAVETNKIINLPIVKHHSLCKATLGMKNLMGIAGGNRSRFHQGIDKTLPDLAAFIKPCLVVMDAVRVLTANGPTGGNLADVKRKDTIVAGTDQVAVDAYGATLLGLKPEEISYVVEANARGLGTMRYETLKPSIIEI
jgi:uncharacterized protein (DUF362 family)